MPAASKAWRSMAATPEAWRSMAGSRRRHQPGPSVMMPWPTMAWHHKKWRARPRPEPAGVDIDSGVIVRTVVIRVRIWIRVRRCFVIGRRDIHRRRRWLRRSRWLRRDGRRRGRTHDITTLRRVGLAFCLGLVSEHDAAVRLRAPPYCSPGGACYEENKDGCGSLHHSEPRCSSPLAYNILPPPRAATNRCPSPIRWVVGPGPWAV